jgi:hypothetical protein
MWFKNSSRFALLGLAYAQLDTASVLGTVVVASSAVIPGATVVVGGRLWQQPAGSIRIAVRLLISSRETKIDLERFKTRIASEFGEFM